MGVDNKEGTPSSNGLLIVTEAKAHVSPQPERQRVDLKIHIHRWQGALGFLVAAQFDHCSRCERPSRHGVVALYCASPGVVDTALKRSGAESYRGKHIQMLFV